jgi:hypothetical protein
MKLPQTGGCQCGKIRYEITEAPQLVCRVGTDRHNELEFARPLRARRLG